MIVNPSVNPSANVWVITKGCISLERYTFLAIVRTMKIEDIISLSQTNHVFEKLVTDEVFMNHLLFDRSPQEICQIHDSILQECIVEYFPWKEAFRLHYSKTLVLGLYVPSKIETPRMYYRDFYMEYARATWFKLKYNYKTNECPTYENVGNACRMNKLPTSQHYCYPGDEEYIEIAFPCKNKHKLQNNKYAIVRYTKYRTEKVSLYIGAVGTKEKVLQYTEDEVKKYDNCCDDDIDHRSYEIAADGITCIKIDVRQEFAHNGMIKIYADEAVNYFYIIKLDEL